MNRPLTLCFAACLLFVGTGCHSAKQPDLGALYNQSAMASTDTRTPVVVIPGILGSKLQSASTMQKVWGSFTFGAADADTPEGARSIALPMKQGAPLSELQDDVIAQDVLDVLVADVAIFRGLKIGAYAQILQTLGVGQYRDQSLGLSGAIDYGQQHYTCYQYPYDWRRDISENALALHEFIIEAQDTVRQIRGLASDTPVKVDVIAHSMGGLVLRYYLRYGPTPLPPEGPLPQVTWAGAENIRKAVLIGTPSAGSVLSFKQLLEGMDLNPVFPNYRPAVLGTMPAVYQLLPRVRHQRIIRAEDGEAIDLYDSKTWQHYGWGLADPKQNHVLEWLLPNIGSAEERQAVALDQLEKCLSQTKRLHLALDQDAGPVPGVDLVLFAGDAEPTAEIISVNTDGSIKVTQKGSGDGTVTRQSALMDERTQDNWQPQLVSPVKWSRVQFVFADHLGLTKDPTFVDNLLFLLLEEPNGDL